MKRLPLPLSICVVLCFLFPANSSADTTSPVTPSEKIFSSNVFDVFTKALPQPLPGYRVHQTRQVIPSEPAHGSKELPAPQISLSAAWTNSELKEQELAAEEEAALNATTQLQEGPWGKEYSALINEQARLNGEITQWTQRGDISKAQELKYQLSRSGQRVSELEEERRAAVRTAVKGLPKTSEIAISLTANLASWQQPAANVDELEPVSGFPAYLCRYPESGKPDDFLIFVGDWQKAGDEETYKLNLAAKPSATAVVRSVVLAVSGGEEPGRQVAESVDWKLIQQKLMK